MIDNSKDYKPLPSYIEVRETLKKGKGIFTTKELHKEDIIGITHYESRKEDKHLFHKGLVRLVLGAMVNHSSTPNCRLIQKDNCYYLQVRNPTILPNTELCINYELYSCGNDYMCIKKIDTVLDEMRYFDTLFRMSDDHEKYKEQEHLEAKIVKLIRELGDTEKGELIQALEKKGDHHMIQHFRL